jgi:hypothetical protein
MVEFVSFYAKCNLQSKIQSELNIYNIYFNFMLNK